jgi:hypothetical protein
MKKIVFQIIAIAILMFSSYQIGRITQYGEVLQRFQKNIKVRYETEDVQKIVFNP